MTSKTRIADLMSLIYDVVGTDLDQNQINDLAVKVSEYVGKSVIYPTTLDNRLTKLEEDLKGLQGIEISNTNRLIVLREQVSSLDEMVVSHDKIIDTVKDLEYKITQLYVKQQGKISEIDTGYSKFDNRLENLTSTVEKMADILINQATETINELTDKKLVGEYE